MQLILTIIVLLAALFYAIRKITGAFKKKEGKSCDGCNGSCTGCPPDKG